MVRSGKKTDLMLFRMIKNAKGPFIAVIVIITIGVCIFVAMQMTYVNMEKTVGDYYEENNFPDLFIQTAPVFKGQIEKIENHEQIEKATARTVIDGQFIAKGEKERTTLRLVTISKDEEELCKRTVINGKAASENPREVLLINKFAKARNIKLGQEIEVQIKGHIYKLKVIGMVESPEYIYLMENNQSIMPDDKNFGVLYVSEEFGRQAFGLNGKYNEILIKYNDVQNEQSLIDDLEEKLKHYGVKSITKKKDQLSNSIINQELTQLKTMAETLPILFLLVACLILMMMLSRMVKKDKIKIGLLKALGYTNKDVLFHYIKFAMMAGIVGGFFGSIFGMLTASGMTRMYLDFFSIPLMKVEFYYHYIALSILLSVGLCTVSGAFGARGATRLSPTETMKPDSPKMGKRIFLEKIKFFWRRLSFSNKMVAKNILRNKKRTIFVLFGVTLTYAMMLYTTSMPGAMNSLMDQHFKEFQKMDYNIGFYAPASESTINDFKHIVSVSKIEGKIEYPYELINGNKKQTLNIIGISTDTDFYSFLDTDDNKVKVPEKGMLISENLAKSLDVKTGEKIKVKSFIQGRNAEYIEVKAIIKQTLGMNAYMNMDYMGEVLFEKNMITGLYVNSDEEKINEKLAKAANIASIMSVEDIRSVYEEYMTMMILSIAFMVLFSGVLGFAIVYNATIVSLSEREMEFSSMRVLGFGKGEIFRMILKENNIISVVGIIIGLPVGNLMLDYSSRAFTTDIYTLKMEPNLNAVLTAMIYTVIFIVVAQLLTYKKIRKLDFLQALKNRAS